MTQPPRTPGRAGPPRRASAGQTATGRAASGRAASGRAASTSGGRTAAGARAASAHPAPGRTGSGRAPGAARRTTAPQPNRFTSRATLLGLVLGALLLAYAYPVRIYLEQQSRIAALRASQAAQQSRINQKADDAAKWDDPAYQAAQATQTLQMVPPGSTSYFFNRSTPSAPASQDPGTAATHPTGPWYGQLWSSVQAADKPQAAP
jgi:cell division protein FtsB